LENATFTGEFPLAKIAFQDRELPVSVTLEAFTPFIPLDVDASGLPVAVLRYTLHNPNRRTARAAIAFSVENPVGVDQRAVRNTRTLSENRLNEYRSTENVQGLLMINPQVAKTAPLAGSFALGIAAVGNGKVTYLRVGREPSGGPALCFFGTTSPMTVSLDRKRSNATELVRCACIARSRPVQATNTHSFWPGTFRTGRRNGAAGRMPETRQPAPALRTQARLSATTTAPVSAMPGKLRSTQQRICPNWKAACAGSSPLSGTLPCRPQ